MKPLDIKRSRYINFNTENNDKDLLFEVSDHVRISKYKTCFCKVLHLKLV